MKHASARAAVAQSLLAAAPFALAAGWSAGNGLDGFLAPWASRVLFWTTIGVAVATAFFIARLNARWKPAFVLATSGLVLVPGYVCAAGSDALTRIDEREAPSGERYALFIVFGKDPVRLLARERRHGLFVSKYEALGTFELNGDDTILVTLPKAQADADRRIWFGRDGRVAVAQDATCWALYDERTASLVRPLHAGPFVLLGPDDVGADSDVAALVAEARAAGARAPEESALLAAIAHGTQWTRDAARRIVEAGGAGMYPEATKRLAEHR